MLVERVQGYDGDGRPCQAVFVDGAEVLVHHYELDPDDRLLRRGRTVDWLARQDTAATHASPVAAALIRRWAQQTAEYGAVDDSDDELADGSDPPAAAVT